MGNHDFRGLENRDLRKVWMFRQPEERSPRDWDLGRNFAVRLGDLAIIGLDTGEDKVDSNPIHAGLANMGPYREAQAQWLKDVGYPTVIEGEVRGRKLVVTVHNIFTGLVQDRFEFDR